jgi:hypothetical protein
MLYNYKEEEKVKAYNEQINHDKSLESLNLFEETINMNNDRIELNITNKIIIDHIKNYNSHRNEPNRIKNIETMIICVRNFINKIVKREYLSDKLTTFDVFYKKKNRIIETVRPLVEMRPVINITFRIMHELMKNDATYKFTDKSLEKKHNFLQNYMEKHEKFLIFFLDFKKAFDSVSRNKLKIVLKYFNLSKYYFLIDFLDTCKYKYDEHVYYYKKFGIPQGLPISTFLFELLVLYVTKKYNKIFHILRFVDDICLIIKNWDLFNSKLNQLIADFKEFGLTLNMEKTYYLSKNIEYQHEYFKEINKDTPEKYLGKYIASSSVIDGIKFLDFSILIQDTIDILKKYPNVIHLIEKSFKWRIRWYFTIYHSINNDEERILTWNTIAHKYQSAINDIQKEVPEFDIKINYSNLMKEVRWNKNHTLEYHEYIYNEI